MKVRVVLTLDVDEEKLHYWYPLLVERAGGVREAVRTHVQDTVKASQPARIEAIRSVELKES